MSDATDPRGTARRRRQQAAWSMLLLLSVYFVAIPAYRYLTTPPPLNVAGFNRIQMGMTMAEVGSLLGGPPGDYGSYGGTGTMSQEWVEGPPDAVQFLWWDDDNRLEVWFELTKWTVVAVHRRASFTRRPVPLSDRLYMLLRRIQRVVRC